MNGADRIAAERQRQIEFEGYDPDNDEDPRELALAGAAYLLAAAGRLAEARDVWPKSWPLESFKPRDFARDVERGGALAAAALDGHDLLAPSPATEADPVQQAIDDPIRWLRRMATDAGATPMTPPPDAVAALEAAHHVDDMGLFDGEVTLAALIAAGWSLSHDSERRSAVIGSERSDNEALVAALEDMIGLATHGAARDHLDQAGVMQDPPHGWGKYAECEAPWCVRNQKRIAAARAAIEGRP